MKHHHQKQLGEERAYLVYNSTVMFIIKEVKTGTQTGREPVGRSRCRGHGVLHTGLPDLRGEFSQLRLLPLQCVKVNIKLANKHTEAFL